MRLGLYTPKIETEALREPGRQSWFREALPPPAFRFNLVVNPAVPLLGMHYMHVELPHARFQKPLAITW